MKFRTVLSVSIQLLLVELVAGRALARPEIIVGPKTLGTHLPLASPNRGKTCVVAGGTADDSDALLNAFKRCNNGGQVILEEDTVYTIGKPLNLTFLQHVDWDIRGTLTFSNDTTFWQANSFKYAFQNSSTFFALGGTDVNVYGGGLIDGGGQIWWNALANNSSVMRPILFNTDGLIGGTISNLRMQNPPNWFNIVQNSKDVVIDNMQFSVFTSGPSPAAASNTDGWDTYRSSNIVIQNSQIVNTDDCVSFKPNSTSILIQNLQCSGSHGISVGSLGQYVGMMDIVSDVYVFNISMSNASDGARIKVFPGAPDAVTLDAGGGSGFVKNVTYELMKVSNVAWAIEVTGCYTVSNLTACALRPPNFQISDVLFSDFSGETSTANKANVATVQCPNVNACQNIRAVNFSVESTLGTNQAICMNVDDATLGLNCTST